MFLVPLVSNNNMMFNADLIVGDSTHMAIGFDTGAPGNWLICVDNSPNTKKVLNYYTVDSSNTVSLNEYFTSEIHH